MRPHATTSQSDTEPRPAADAGPAGSEELPSVPLASGRVGCIFLGGATLPVLQLCRPICPTQHSGLSREWLHLRRDVEFAARLCT